MGGVSVLDAAAEWEYRRLYLSRQVSRRAAQQLLTDYAEYGHWELDRLWLCPDGSRRVVLRRRIIRQRRSASPAPSPV
jgi:Family of unknown function (DUF5703)